MTLGGLSGITFEDYNLPVRGYRIVLQETIDYTFLENHKCVEPLNLHREAYTDYPECVEPLNLH